MMRSWLGHCEIATDSSEGKKEHRWNGILSKARGCFYPELNQFEMLQRQLVIHIQPLSPEDMISHKLQVICILNNYFNYMSYEVQ